MNLLIARLPSVAKMLAFPTLLLLGASAQADVNFTFTGTNTDGLVGYNIGQSYTFTFVVNGAFAVGTNAFSTDNDIWQQLAPTDDVLFSNFTGSGIAGSLTGNPLGVVQVVDNYTGPGQDAIITQFTGASGLTANGVPLFTALAVIIEGGNITDTFPGAYIAPQSVFSAITTTPAGSGSAIRLTTAGGQAYFDMDSFSIDAGPAEVPFGVDSSVGLAVLGLAGAWKLRRRKLAAAQAAS